MNKLLFIVVSLLSSGVVASEPPKARGGEYSLMPPRPEVAPTFQKNKTTGFSGEYGVLPASETHYAELPPPPSRKATMERVESGYGDLAKLTEKAVLKQDIKNRSSSVAREYAPLPDPDAMIKDQPKEAQGRANHRGSKLTIERVESGYGDLAELTKKAVKGRSRSGTGNYGPLPNPDTMIKDQPKEVGRANYMGNRNAVLELAKNYGDSEAQSKKMSEYAALPPAPENTYKPGDKSNYSSLEELRKNIHEKDARIKKQVRELQEFEAKNPNEQVMGKISDVHALANGAPKKTIFHPVEEYVQLEEEKIRRTDEIKNLLDNQLSKEKLSTQYPEKWLKNHSEVVEKIKKIETGEHDIHEISKAIDKAKVKPSLLEKIINPKKIAKIAEYNVHLEKAKQKITMHDQILKDLNSKQGKIKEQHPGVGHAVRRLHARSGERALHEVREFAVKY